MTTEDARKLHDKAKNCLRKKHYDEARQHLEGSIKKQKTAEAYYDLGLVHQMQNRSGAAISAFASAIETNPDYLPPYDKLIEDITQKGQKIQMLAYYPMAIKARPDHFIYKKNFLTLVRDSRVLIFNPDLKNALLECLKTPDLDFSGIELFWFSLLKTDPEFKPIYKLAKLKNYASFKAAFSCIKDTGPMLSPYFLLGLQKLIVFNPEFEQFVKYLRRLFLDNVNVREGIFNDPSFADIVLALSHYCFSTEYIISLSDEEKHALSLLKVSGDEFHARDIVITACYSPLFKLADSQKIQDSFQSSALSDLIERQIKDPSIRLDIARSIESLTTITGGVSSMVRAQYEEFPYPQWTAFSADIKNEETEGYLKKGKPKILVAGCGTGKEAVELGAAFPNAKILAVDLSLGSLAYGMQQAKKFKVKNITFKQADILNLGTLNETYDFIACSGVLHHMEDPAKGLAVLVQLMKPGATIRLALYSKTARREIVKAREIIQENNYASDADGIRRFRDGIAGTLGSRARKNIMKFRDYYSMSECRDLLFHVQEHQFNPVQIKDLLSKFGLEFTSFYLADKILKKYRKKFRNDPEATNLDNWARFEKTKPDTFVGMYKFWCRKGLA